MRFKIASDANDNMPPIPYRLTDYQMRRHRALRQQKTKQIQQKPEYESYCECDTRIVVPPYSIKDPEAKAVQLTMANKYDRLASRATEWLNKTEDIPQFLKSRSPTAP